MKGGGQYRLTVRSVLVGGRRATIRLDPVMWDALEDIAERQGRSTDDLIPEIHGSRGERSLAAAIRIFIVQFYRAAASGVSPDERRGQPHRCERTEG